MHGPPIDLTATVWGFLGLAVLLLAYALVVYEEHTQFRKSKPVLLAACVIWLFVAFAYHGTPHAERVPEAFKHNFLEYTEILLFLLVAMTYINVLEELHVFEALRSRLIQGGWSLRQLFWLTGTLAFFISPVADNMTTALIMGAVAVSVGGKNTAFIAAACVNIVVAANAGGAFSPFGDITTLMVWQKGAVEFFTFFHLFVPALVTWLIPACLMARAISAQAGIAKSEPLVNMKPGAKRTMALFGFTIACAVAGHNMFHMPPVWGMLLGLSLLKILGYLLKIRAADDTPFDIFRHVERLEWDTLLFFGGIILAVGGIGFMGYLTLLSSVGYAAWGPLSVEQSVTLANVAVGLLSAVIDNIPLMFAVLTMDPQMSTWQWLLVTLTAGVGGSLLSVGSAAGVALMGTSKGNYTFSSHLRHTPAIALGYILGIVAHYGWALAMAPGLFTSN